MSRQVLVTGANGFVGAALCRELERRGYQVRKAVRTLQCGAAVAGEQGNEVAVGDIGPETEWAEALSGVHAVVHLAARVHVMNDSASDPLTEYRHVNVQGTANLARQAAATGVRRFVFLSSVKVHGEATSEAPFRESDLPAPVDAYGLSKWEAEEEVWRTSRETGLEAVVVRPPLVYGPGVKANFFRLMQAIARGLPLPFGIIENGRSLVFLGNLADGLIACLEQPRAAGETFLISDGAALATPELVRTLASALRRPARLLPVPSRMLLLVGKVAGREAAVQRLCGSLRVDSGKMSRRLGWTPPYTAAAGLQATADWYLSSRVEANA